MYLKIFTVRFFQLFVCLKLFKIVLGKMQVPLEITTLHPEIASFLI